MDHHSSQKIHWYIFKSHVVSFDYSYAASLVSTKHLINDWVGDTLGGGFNPIEFLILFFVGLLFCFGLGLLLANIVGLIVGNREGLDVGDWMGLPVGKIEGLLIEWNFS